MSGLNEYWEELQQHNMSGWNEDHNEHGNYFDVQGTSEFSTDMAFSFREELIDWVQKKGRSLGYVIVIKRSKTGPNGVINKIVFQCDRGGEYRGDKTSSTISGTKKINCPFGLVGRYFVKHECWKLRVQCGTHNHEPALYLEGHPYAARLSVNETQLVNDLSATQVKPRVILSTIKNQNPDNASTLKTIYNARNKARMIDKEGSTQMQFLMSFLVKENYFFQTRVNNLTNELEDLFFAHPISLDLWRAFPHVVLMDATYKTNKYKMPLFEIVGVTSTNLTFCIAFVFMSNENQSSYTWALDCLKSTMNGCISPRVMITDRELGLIKAINNVFPDAKQLLCRWHICESVMKRSKKKISGHYSQNAFYDAWNRLVQSPTEEEYSNNLTELQTILKDYQDVLAYLNDTWLSSYKEMFVSVWTDKFLHFGNHTTNRVESQHARYKLYLNSSQADLESSLYLVHNMIQAQETHIKASFEKSKIVMKHRYNIPQFKELCGFVSLHAMDLIYNEFMRCNAVGVFSENCGCQLRTSHGLPCAHEQSLYYSQNQPIPHDSIDIFWRKLDFAPCITLHNDDIGCEDEVQMFTNIFQKQSRPNKFSFLRKLKEIVMPSATLMREPIVQKTTRGRPSLKEKNIRSFHFDSSPQEPPRRSYYNASKFDDIDVSRDQVPARHSCYVSGYQAPDETEEEIEFIDQFEPILRKYIKKVQNVRGDGNCGFRSISVCLGFSEENWIQIRQDLLDELRNNRPNYDDIFGLQYSKQIEASLSWFYIGKLAPPEYWMTMPGMGVLISSRYDRILHVLSSHGSCTYLPFWSTPKHWATHRPITIGFVDGNHYVSVTLEGGYPMPTIYSQWFYRRDPCAEGWATPYHARLQQYTNYIESKRTVEYAVVDD